MKGSTMFWTSKDQAGNSNSNHALQEKKHFRGYLKDIYKYMYVKAFTNEDFTGFFLSFLPYAFQRLLLETRGG